jgi:hypothetical protein
MDLSDWISRRADFTPEKPAILLPLNWRLSALEHAQLLQHARPLALFAEGGLLEHINGVKEQFENVVLVRFDEPGSDQPGVIAMNTGVTQ